MPGAARTSSSKARRTAAGGEATTARFSGETLTRVACAQADPGKARPQRRSTRRARTRNASRKLAAGAVSFRLVVFRQFVDDDLGCASYLIGDPATGEALVVDPAYAIEQYLDDGVRIVRVLETHTHADHVSGHGRFALE